MKQVSSNQLVPWNAIKEVHAKQIDMLTYFENFFIFILEGHDPINIGELAVGVEKLDEALRYLGIERDWYAELESGGPGTTLLLYNKANSAS